MNCRSMAGSNFAKSSGINCKSPRSIGAANWLTASSEYEKFMELYEKSTGAPFAQLKWSLAQVKLRKQKHGDQEGLPDGHRLLARLATSDCRRPTTSDAPRRRLAKRKKRRPRLKNVVAKHPDHLVAVYATQRSDRAGHDRKRTSRLGSGKLEETDVRHQEDSGFERDDAFKRRSNWPGIRSVKERSTMESNRWQRPTPSPSFLTTCMSISGHRSRNWWLNPRQRPRECRSPTRRLHG